MNEDIFSRLHYQSGLVAQGCWDELDQYDREAIRRFGDLIVKECAEIANDHNSEVEGVTLGVGRALKQHFGITE
jgi:hypothetical protein